MEGTGFSPYITPPAIFEKSSPRRSRASKRKRASQSPIPRSVHPGNDHHESTFQYLMTVLMRDKAT
jgi:hypothetical protein